MSKLTYENQWELDIYKVDGKRVKTMTEVEIDGEKYSVTNRKVSVPYKDMGHEYYGTSTHYFVNVKVGNVSIEVDLNEIIRKRGVSVIATKYTTDD